MSEMERRQTISIKERYRKREIISKRQILRKSERKINF